MRFFDSLCETVTRVLGLSALSPWEAQDPAARPLQTPFIRGGSKPASKVEVGRVTGPQPSEIIGGTLPASKQVYWGEDVGKPNEEPWTNAFGVLAEPKLHQEPDLPPGPVFKPSDSSKNFKCDYSAMRGWHHVGNSDVREAWLEKPIDTKDDTGGIYDIFTDVDLYWPTGIVRKYHLNVTDHPINADGVSRTTGGKTFNEMYPGPHIEACWGDWVEITVENHLRYNGTTVHFHGARQYKAFEYDGVNGVSQCPIAPGDSFTYKFRVTQHGTSWYHSHYSLQYADGLAGPMTFYGPESSNYDEALEPFLFSDWSHNSAFEDYYWELHGGHPMMQTTILNGKGFFNCTLNPTPDCHPEKAPKIHEVVFERRRKYLLRLINTSTASTFVFSIDKHILKVVSADFVSIEPYYAESISVGIGQRYNVIVEARPSNELLADEDQNYWIRIVAAEMCDPIIQNNPLVGIIRYDAGSTKLPVSKPYEFSTLCRDEPFASVVPVVPKTVDAKEHPANNIKPHGGDFFNVAVEKPQEPKYLVPYGDFWRWDIMDLPMWLNFSDPTINHLQEKDFNPIEYAIIDENYKEDQWVYIILSAEGDQNEQASRRFIPLAHPVHLHGHDFIMIAQEHRPFKETDLTDGTFKWDNPPRRDSVLLPGGGYVAIAFQPDNPGIWAYHCHIAWHASSGFAVQVREREPDAQLTPEFTTEKDRVCRNWRKWHSNKKNWWDEHEFQEDSGL